jgi:hypothetical protein
MYKADFPYVWDHDGEEVRLNEGDFKFKPSIHMPKWAARIWLEITDIRVERVQDITDSASIKEGIQWDDACPENVSSGWCPCAFDTPKESFQYLWNSINESRGVGWDVNPWVWVIEFKVVDK